MIDFAKHAERSRAAKARACPKCRAAPTKPCRALGGKLDGWRVEFEKGDEVILFHVERYAPEPSTTPPEAA